MLVRSYDRVYDTDTWEEYPKVLADCFGLSYVESDAYNAMLAMRYGVKLIEGYTYTLQLGTVPVIPLGEIEPNWGSHTRIEAQFNSDICYTLILDDRCSDFDPELDSRVDLVLDITTVTSDTLLTQLFNKGWNMMSTVQQSNTYGVEAFINSGVKFPKNMTEPDLDFYWRRNSASWNIFKRQLEVSVDRLHYDWVRKVFKGYCVTRDNVVMFVKAGRLDRLPGTSRLRRYLHAGYRNTSSVAFFISSLTRSIEKCIT